MTEQNFSRTLLVVVDDTPEMNVALRYATWRAQQTHARVAMLTIIEPTEIQPWGNVGDKLSKDVYDRAEAKLKGFSSRIAEVTGVAPLHFVRQGEKHAALLQLLADQSDISAVVLAANTGNDGPGPLVKYLTSSKGLRTLKVPVMIVPDTYRADIEGDSATLDI